MGLTGVRHELEYIVVQDMAQLGHPITWVCQALSISRSAYYHWLHRTPSARERENRHILDLKANDIVAFNISPSNNNNLVFTTFDRAIEKYPDAHPLVHSDRGFQYTNLKFKIKLRKQGMLQSMSRAGMCVDNAPMEAFWGTLKSEMYHLDQFDDYDTLAQAICDYIHFYNTRRRQRRLDKLPPLAYRAQQALLSESGES